MPKTFRSTYISSATGTTVKTGRGVLGSIILGETAAGAITVYDGTDTNGTVIAVLKASIVEGTYEFNRSVENGIHVVTAGASKLTVTFE